MALPLTIPPQAAPPDEQEVCVACGFCCDGTLFLHACLQPGERGHLPEKIEANSYAENGEEFFRLPCPYFRGKCTIYDRPRADVCGSFRCELLLSMEKGAISKAEALALVARAHTARQELLHEFCRLTGFNGTPNLRQILTDLGKWRKNLTDDDPLTTETDLLMARINILEALLIKHFHPASEFQNMMVNSQNHLKAKQ